MSSYAQREKEMAERWLQKAISNEPTYKPGVLSCSTRGDTSCRETFRDFGHQYIIKLPEEGNSCDSHLDSISGEQHM